MDIKTINLVIKIENIFCIYRNYFSLSRKSRILVNIRSIVETTVLVICLILQMFYCGSIPFSKTFTFSLKTTNSLIILILARFHTESFRKLLTYIIQNHKHFAIYSDYLKNLERKYKTLKILLCCYAMYSILLFIFRRITDDVNSVNYFFYMNLICCDVRYSIEYVVTYSILVLLTEHMDCICRCIENDIKAFEIEASDDINWSQTIRLDLNRFTKWTKAFTNVKESSDLFNTIFGVQITVVLLTAMLYFIMFLYNVAYISVSGRCGTAAKAFYYSMQLLLYITALFMLSRGAHGLQSSADNLRRQLAKLLIHCPFTHGSYRATKDLIRLVATRKLRTRAFGSLPIDMSLLPSSVLFFTSYTVIALQFNNVI